MLENAILLHNFLPQNNLISFSDLFPEKATRQTVSFSLDREKIRAKEGLIKTQDHKKKKKEKNLNSTFPTNSPGIWKKNGKSGKYKNPPKVRLNTRGGTRFTMTSESG